MKILIILINVKVEKQVSCKCEGKPAYPHTYPHPYNRLFVNMLLWMCEGVRVKRPKKIPQTFSVICPPVFPIVWGT